MEEIRETIAAIATALSPSGISIIRISGAEAFSVIDRIYRSPGGKKRLSLQQDHTIHYGFIYDGKTRLDEVMVSLMRGPKSYTGEDTVEINCHGGVLVTRKILDAVCQAGARLAEPGEFTRRAFLNGRMDLAEAEAVMDVIQAKNEYALRSSLGRLEGRLSKEIHEIRDEILDQIAYIEAALDDPEHITLEGYAKELTGKLQENQVRLQQLLERTNHGRLLADGIRTVILGKPNAGKSSLLNLFSGEDRAIVTEYAGTTRDTLEETIQLGGIVFQMVDTAGIRQTQDPVEKIGVERAKRAAREADLILYVVDSTQPMDEEDQSLLQEIKDKACIILMNKIDLQEPAEESAADTQVEKLEAPSAENGWSKLGVGEAEKAQISRNEELPEVMGYPVVRMSARTGEGAAALEQLVTELFFAGSLPAGEETYLANARQKECVSQALHSLKLVQEAIAQQLPEDFYTIDLMNAYEQLGLLLGEELQEDLVNRIFEKFCMGK